MCVHGLKLGFLFVDQTVQVNSNKFGVGDLTFQTVVAHPLNIPAQVVVVLVADVAIQTD